MGGGRSRDDLGRPRGPRGSRGPPRPSPRGSTTRRLPAGNIHSSSSSLLALVAIPPSPPASLPARARRPRVREFGSRVQQEPCRGSDSPLPPPAPQFPTILSHAACSRGVTARAAGGTRAAWGRLGPSGQAGGREGHQRGRLANFLIQLPRASPPSCSALWAPRPLLPRGGGGGGRESPPASPPIRGEAPAGGGGAGRELGRRGKAARSTIPAHDSAVARDSSCRDSSPLTHETARHDPRLPLQSIRLKNLDSRLDDSSTRDAARVVEVTGGRTGITDVSDRLVAPWRPQHLQQLQKLLPMQLLLQLLL
ncbi:unnamed protein product [Lampetra planeri]